MICRSVAWPAHRRPGRFIEQQDAGLIVQPVADDNLLLIASERLETGSIGSPILIDRSRIWRSTAGRHLAR